MAQELHPAVKRIFDPNKYVCRPSVEIFTEHAIRGKDGKEIKVGKEDLEQFAKVNNEKAAKGALSTVGAGHTFDDQYDKDGNLEKKFPEEKQPTPLGFLYRYEVKYNQHTKKWSLYADEHIEKYIKDPETGQMVDGLKYTASFPRRSAEAYHNEKWIDHVAMIRRAPRLDLGVVAYAKNDPAHALYSKDKDGKELYAYQFARGKVRYSFDTGEGTMEPNDQSPAAPATAEEKAWASIIILSAIAGAVFGVGGGVAIYFGHVKVGLILILTGLALPITAKMLTTEWVIIVGVIGAIISGVLYAAWHFVKDKIPVEYGGTLPPAPRSGLSL